MSDDLTKLSNAELLAEVAALTSGASSAPWVADTVDKLGENWCVGFVMDLGIDTENRKWIVTTKDVRGTQLGGGAKEDAEFIAFARQALPELARRLAEAEELYAMAKGIIELDTELLEETSDAG